MQGSGLISKTITEEEKMEILRHIMHNSVTNIKLLTDEETIRASRHMDVAIVDYMKKDL